MASKAQKYIDKLDKLDIKNMYENGSSYESICEVIGIDYEDYEEM